MWLLDEEKGRWSYIWELLVASCSCTWYPLEESSFLGLGYLISSRFMRNAGDNTTIWGRIGEHTNNQHIENCQIISSFGFEECQHELPQSLYLFESCFIRLLEIYLRVSWNRPIKYSNENHDEPHRRKRAPTSTVADDQHIDHQDRYTPRLPEDYAGSYVWTTQ